MAFKMKGPSLYKNGANLKVQKNYAGQADGRATSSPFQQKEEGKEKLNEWGETPDQYKKRMEEMGLRKPDKKSDKKTPLEQKVDPDAPGIPGTPGYEPPVKRSDLDAKGKAIWDRNHAKGKKKKGSKSGRETEGQDEDKIFDNNGRHVGDYVNGKKVMLAKK